MRSDAIKPGDVIGGKYRVRGILSRTRGFLVEAVHTELGQRVVVRVLSPQLVEDKEVERFRREAQTLAKLESEHVARILDVGHTEDGAFFYARQYLEGQDLATHLAERGQLPVSVAVLYVLQAAAAVAETHVHGIILRELQLSHLFLTQRLGGQQIKIIDFGTAKLMRGATAAPDGEMTTMSNFGLTCYSSPEVVRRAPGIDGRADVWSLGAILYQLLTGKPPFEGEMAALMLAIARSEPVPITQQRRDVPRDFDSIIAWALAKDPAERFADVYGLAHALLPFATPEGQILVKRIGYITNAGDDFGPPPPGPAGGPPQAFSQAGGPPQALGQPGRPLQLPPDDDGPRTAYRPADAPAVNPGYRANVAPAAPPAPAVAAPPAPAAPPEGNPFNRTQFIPQAEPGPSPVARGASIHATLPLLGAGFALPASTPAPGPAAGRPAAGQPYPGQPYAAQPAVGQPYAGQPAGRPNPAQPAEQHPGRPAWQPMPAPLAPVATGDVPLSPGGTAPLASFLPAPSVAGFPQTADKPRPVVKPSMPTIQSSSARARAMRPPRAQKMALAVVAGAVVLLTLVAVLVVYKARPGRDPVRSGPAVGSGAASASAASSATASAASATVSAAPPAPGSASATTAPSDSATPDAGAGEDGTLVAVAFGGSCAFSVNGAAKGTMSTLRLTVKPGTYSVTCAPRLGWGRSRRPIVMSVTVVSGATAQATFKL